MGKEIIIHSCGCSEVHNLSGSYKSRAYRMEQLATEPCAECAAKARAAKIAATNAASAAKAEAAARPELTGSDKQVAWATTIRENQAANLEAISAPTKKMLPTLPEAHAATAKALLAWIEAAEANTSASFWIDRRNHGAEDWKDEFRASLKK